MEGQFPGQAKAFNHINGGGLVPIHSADTARTVLGGFARSVGYEEVITSDSAHGLAYPRAMIMALAPRSGKVAAGAHRSRAALTTMLSPRSTFP